MEKKQGFTLAEVLITLVIIGIIASMTLPSLLGGTNKQEIKTGLQKAISVLTQTITLQYALTGEDFSSMNSYDSVLNFAKTRLNLKGTTTNISQITTRDGIIYDLSNVATGCTQERPCQITVDANGSKKPNEVTSDDADSLADIKDQFSLYVYGTTVSTDKTTCTTQEGEDGSQTTSCNTVTNTAAARFINDEIRN